MMARHAADLVLDARAEVGEGPRWDHRSQRLVWVDIHGRTVHLFDPVTGLDVSHDFGGFVGAAALRAAGGYAVVLPDGVAAWQPPEPVRRVVAVTEEAGRRFNDAACDPAGRLFAGTIDMSAGGEGRGRLYQITDVATLIVDGLGLPNGIDWSPDGRTMYFTDSLEREIGRFPYDVDTGRIGDRAGGVPIRNGLPDGHTVDADGNLWVAQWSAGTVVCLTPEGRELATVTVPVAAVTSCAFGGPDLSTLFITTMQQPDGNGFLEPTAGGLFACSVGGTGREPHPFAW